jgi:DNA replication protein DnaC
MVNAEGKLTRYHRCREHLDPARLKAEGFDEVMFVPSYPALFRDTEVSKLHPRLQSAAEWTPNGQKSGLLLHGTTGVGKTRLAWHVVNRLWIEKARKDMNMPYRFLTMRKFEGLIEESFGEKAHSKMLDELIKTDLLVFDDLGKERATARMASDLFAVLDERTTAMRPTVITTNFNGSALVDRFDDKEMAAALVRRFRDYYTLVGAGA